jgi:hypothetical protein
MHIVADDDGPRTLAARAWHPEFLFWGTALYREFGRPQEYVKQMASPHRINAGAVLKQIRGPHDAFPDEGVIRFRGCAFWIEAPRNTAKSQALETTCNKMMNAKGLKFEYANSGTRTVFGNTWNRSLAHKN